MAQQKRWWQNHLLSEGNNVYRILCIGESTTLAGGQDSYPSQLERILNKDGKKRRFQVINQGIAGVHTIKILNNLPGWIDTYKPQMVIAMIGALDPIKDTQQDAAPLFIKEMKLYQLSVYVQEKIAQEFQEHILMRKRQIKQEAKADYDSGDDYDLFKDLVAKEPPQQRKVFMLLGLALIDRRYDIAETLFQEVLKQNTNPVMHRCIIKKYGEFLILTEQYGKFVDIMSEIPFDSWGGQWVKGFCHGQGNMDRVRNVIEGMVINKKEDPHVYGYVASCYEEGGRKDLAEQFLERMGSKSSYYAPETRANYRAIRDILYAKHIQPVFVQYPLRNIRPLRSIFDNEIDRNKIIFVDNESSFKKLVEQSSYDLYFVDRALGDTGHATGQGNYVLASNIAQKILEKVPSQ